MPIANDKTIKQKEASYQIELKMRKLFDEMLATYTEIFNYVWYNNGLTPQEVMDCLGTRAVDMFVLAGLCVNTLNTAQSGTITHSPPYQFTVNEDGTVTVGDPVS